MSVPPRRPLLILDGDNLAHRAFHSMPSSLRAADGRPINAIVGWTTMALGLWEAERPRAVLVAWDTQDTPTYRHALWPAYQSGRAFDPNLVAQLGLLPDLARALGFAVEQRAGWEADDLMASAAVAEAASGGSALLLTTDRDAYQVVSPAIGVLNPRRGVSVLERIGPAEVEERLGVRPEQVPDYKALAGDPSDVIPGVRGIGPRTAAKLLRAHGSLDAVLAAWAAEGTRLDEAERLRAFRDVARARTDLPVALPPDGPPRWAQGAAWLRGIGAESLAGRVERMGERLAPSVL